MTQGYSRGVVVAGGIASTANSKLRSRSRLSYIGQVLRSLLGLVVLYCSAATAQTCPTGQFLGPWKIVQSLGLGSFNTFPYGPCASLGQRFGSPDAASAACSPTGAFSSNINWAPQTIIISSLGSADGTSSSFLYGFTENSFSTINGQETVIEYAGRAAAFCTSAQNFVQAPPAPAARADAGSACPFCKNDTDPVNPSSGNEFLAETDIRRIGSRTGLTFRRFYNSLDTDAGDLGPGWSRSFSRRLTFQFSNPLYSGGSLTSSLYATPDAACTTGWGEVAKSAPGLALAAASYSGGTCTLSANGATVATVAVSQVPIGGGSPALLAVQAFRDDGHVITFTASGSTFTAEPGVDEHLTTTASGGYQLTDAEDNVETYDSTGKLLSVADRAGNTQTLSYDPTFGLLSTVTDNFGHTLTFIHNSNHEVASVAAPDGSAVQFAYDSAGHLSQVTNLDGSTRQYLYTDPNWPLGISSVVDESAQTVFTLSYDTQGRVLSSTLGGVSSSMGFTYNSDGSTTETDPLGAARTFAFQQVGNHELSSSVSGSPCQPCGYKASTTYDSGGFPASETDFNGNVTTYVYDDTRGLETSRTEAFGASVARTITTEWSPAFRLPMLISEYPSGSATGTPLRTTAFTYDGSGNLLTKTVTDPATGAARTWTYTYDAYGRVLTLNGPRTDVSDLTTYTYYTCTTGSQCGELETATDPLGHVTTYNTYDADGRPLTITDPNATVKTLSYDARGRLKSELMGGETTAFTYYPTGLLEKVTLPDGSSLSYTYDAAHRLTQVSDGLGNKIVYTLDAMGNRTAENSYDASGTLHRTHTRVINALNEVYQEVNAAGTAAVTTTFGYDSDGNATSIDAPLSRNTAQSYDALNRVSSITDPGTGGTTFGYDAEDDLTSVKDPRNLTTAYGYDGLGDLTSQVSPDTGTTTDTYDSAGNLATATDARGAVATYGYDALNRVTSIAYSLSGTTDQALSFTYDQGTDGIGHLTGASDANHSMSFGYDALGEMTGASEIVGGVTRSVAYAYTNGDLTSLTTPSGQTITYGYNANHQVTSIAVNGTSVISNASYEPLGPVDGWTWGNGSAFSRTFNGDGLITGISNPGSQQSASYDDASRITGITNTALGSPAPTTYTYDALDRLTGAISAALFEGWTYDADGNRLSETGSSPETYSLSSTRNEITAITGTLGRSYAYDAAGDTLSDTKDTFAYNDAGRLVTLTDPTATTSFVYNALGQIIKASNSSGTTLFVHDQTGHLLGEYDGSGNLIQETVWLGNIPVATLRSSGSSVAIYYIATDQLDIPREVIRPSDNVLMWTWFSQPFGSDAPNENPQFAGTFVYDLRFPGQVAGSWGRFLPNGYRDYDPSIGRYDESDPIGLAGGSYSTYAYVRDNPVMLMDSLGTNPGDSFPSTEAAAVDAFNYINSLQDCHTHEYAGWIYEKWSLFGSPTYTYDEPTELSPTGGVMPAMPAYHGTYAMFHNHPALPGYDSDNYSPADEDTADYHNIPSYLEIPSGVIKRYTPNPGHPREGPIDRVGKTSCSCKAQ